MADSADTTEQVSLGGANGGGALPAVLPSSRRGPDGAVFSSLLRVP